MKRLMPGQRDRITDLVSKMDKLADEITSEFDEVRGIMDTLATKVGGLVTDYNECVADLRSIYEDAHEDATDYYEERSDRWKEGDAGTEYAQWMEQLENHGIEEIEVEIPTELEPPDFPDFEDDSWLPPPAPGDDY